jgi:galactonate dehydratase
MAGGLAMNRRDFLVGSAAAGVLGRATASAQPSEPPRQGGRPKGGLKITEVQVYLGAVGGRHPVMVRVLTDAGVSGLGEAALFYGTGATAAAGMIKDLAEQFLLGRDPFPIEAHWSAMYDHTFWAKGGGPIVFDGISALEQALWDIKGKCLGVPVYELLGGRIRDSVRVYANGWSFTCVEPAEFARAAERVVASGYTALKMYPLATPQGPYGGFGHVTRRSIDRAAEERAVASVKAVRAAVGPGVDLMLDMSAELTTDAILRIGRRVQDSDIAFFEEPVDPFDVDALKQVSEQLQMPIAVGERLYTRYGFRRVLERQAAHIVQPDIGNTGGIMEAKKIAAMAEAYNMRVAPHNAAGPICTAAELQLDACISNFLIQEVYPFRAPETYAIVDRAPEREIRDGRMPISDRPGLGIELVEERARPFLWARCR